MSLYSRFLDSVYSVWPVSCVPVQDSVSLVPFDFGLPLPVFVILFIWLFCSVCYTDLFGLTL